MDKNMKGTFMLGIDVELAWGLVYRKKIDLSEITTMSINVRSALDSVLALFERFQIPATWSILGHLMLDHCDRDNDSDLPHPDMPRPSYSWLEDDWYRYDPCSNLEKDPAWYGKDIVGKIIQYVGASKLPHEIGCHSFSHQLFGDPECGEEVARAEITKCLDLMNEEYGLIPRVFTFPRAYTGHIGVLKELGFIAFVDTPPKLYPCVKMERTIANYVKTYLSLALQFLSYYFLFPPHVVAAEEPLSGLWAVKGCLGYGKKPLIPLSLVTAKAIQGIDKAVREQKIFSMFAHLKEFGVDGFFGEFEKVLEHVDRRRKEGKLEVKTLSGLVSEYT